MKKESDCVKKLVDGLVVVKCAGWVCVCVCIVRLMEVIAKDW